MRHLKTAKSKFGKNTTRTRKNKDIRTSTRTGKRK